MLSSCCPSNARRRDGGCQARHLVRPGLAEDNCHVTWRNQLRRTGVQVPRLGGRGGAASCPIAWDLPTRELDPRSRRTSLLGATRCHARGRRLGRPRYLLGPSTANLSRSLQRPSMRRRYLSTLSTLVDLCPPSFLPVQSTTFTQQARAGAVFLSCLAVLHAVHLLSVPDLAFAFPPSPALLFSPANAVKLARPEPLSGAPILHRPPNTKRYLHAPTGSNRTAALPHYRLWHIRPVWGYGHFLPCLPVLPAYRRAQQTRSAHSVSDTIPPDLGRCARISPSPLPPSRQPTPRADRPVPGWCLSVGCCSSPSLVCPVSAPDSHPILAPDNIHHRPVSRPLVRRPLVAQHICWHRASPSS